MRKVVSAGGIFVRNNNGVVEILLLKRDSGKLGLLKGHQEKGETLEETAIREVKEETGLNNFEIVKKIGEFTRPGKEKSGEEVLKTIHLFLMKTDDYTSKNAEENFGWFEFNEGINMLKDTEEKDFLRSNIDVIIN